MKPGIARSAALLVLFAIPTLTSPRASISSPDAGVQRKPVLVELFTSEGCSSCPPADNLLANLEKNQPVAGAEVIALSEHVDYWNRLGWIDPFSAPEFSTRQSRYAEIFRKDGIYTPQMIVDGQIEFVGSDVFKAREAIIKAAQTGKASVQIMRAGTPGANGGTSPVRLSIRIERIPLPHRGLEALLAITESNLQSQVARGENAGRKLSHTSVVRKIRPIGVIASGTSGFSAEPQMFIERKWKRQDLQAVVFMQERETGRVLGVGVVGLGE